MGAGLHMHASVPTATSQLCLDSACIHIYACTCRALRHERPASNHEDWRYERGEGLCIRAFLIFPGGCEGVFYTHGEAGIPMYVLHTERDTLLGSIAAIPRSVCVCVRVLRVWCSIPLHFEVRAGPKKSVIEVVALYAFPLP